MEEEVFIVNGYRFNSEADANIARSETRKIAFIEERMNYNKPETVAIIYQKMLDANMFVTPEGMAYLKSVRDFLVKSGQAGEEELSPVVVRHNYAEAGTPRERPDPVAESFIREQNRQRGRLLFISAALNVILIIAIIIMFVIALNSDNPNVINYERAIQDRYSQWEMELQEREEAVREREIEQLKQE